MPRVQAELAFLCRDIAEKERRFRQRHGGSGVAAPPTGLATTLGSDLAGSTVNLVNGNITGAWSIFGTMSSML